MSAAAHPAPGRDTLESAREQLLAYARDLNQVLASEREKQSALAASSRQLLAFAHDLNAAYRQEQEKARELENAYQETVHRLLRASQYKDRDTGAHNRRLSHYAKALALAMGWSDADARLLFDATPMHDIGKIGVPDAVLFKPGPLSPQEWRIIKRHCAIGAGLLAGSTSPLLQMGRTIALCHHERWNGSGYPRRLKNEAIPACARLVAVADQYDAMRSLRPYKPAMSHVTTVDALLGGDGRTSPEHFDPAVLRTLRAIHTDFEAIFAHYGS